MAGRKRRGWNKYIADYDKLRMFLRYISYGCYHKQYLARQLGQSARSYEDNWARVRSFLPEDRLQAVRQGHREIHSLKGDSYHSAFNDLARSRTLRRGAVPVQAHDDRILDDDVLYALACCIAERRAVRFRYRGKGVVAIPLRLITDFESGRQYLLAIRKRRTVSKRFTIAQSYRIDFMQEVQPARTIKNQPDVTLPERHILRLAFRYDDERGRDHLIYRIREHEPKAVIRDDGLGTLHVTLETVDDLKLMPWLRTFYPTVRVEKDGPAHLAERMKIDIEEALKHYGIRPALP